MLRRNIKKGQEEMVGFVLILVIVAVIFLVLLAIVARRPASESIEKSEEVDSFLSGVLAYTTSCSLGLAENYQSIEDLIFACSDGKQCFDGEEACGMLEKDLKGMLQEGWPFGEERPIKGYWAEVVFGNGKNLTIQEGNKTRQYLSAVQVLAEDNSITINIHF